LASPSKRPAAGRPWGANSTWTKRLAGMFPTDRLEREVLLRGTCPECNLMTRPMSGSFSVLVGPGSLPSLSAALMEGRGIAHWRSCDAAHAFLSSLVWSKAVLSCWRCQRPLLLGDGEARCPSCAAIVNLEAFCADSRTGAFVSWVHDRMGPSTADGRARVRRLPGLAQGHVVGPSPTLDEGL